MTHGVLTICIHVSVPEALKMREKENAGPTNRVENVEVEKE